MSSFAERVMWVVAVGGYAIGVAIMLTAARNRASANAPAAPPADLAPNGARSDG